MDVVIVQTGNQRTSERVENLLSGSGRKRGRDGDDRLTFYSNVERTSVYQ
jgi:hypothetical protein